MSRALYSHTGGPHPPSNGLYGSIETYPMFSYMYTGAPPPLYHNIEYVAGYRGIPWEVVEKHSLCSSMEFVEYSGTYTMFRDRREGK